MNQPAAPAPANDAIDLKISRSGDALLPSAVRKEDGSPRFTMPIDRAIIDSDAGVSYMVRHELFHDGFERLTRDLIDAHLRPGDLFIDVGAHFGIMALSAATRYPGQVHVLAIEPHPQNLWYLMKAIRANKLQANFDVISAAAGAKAGIMKLVINSTMGHSLLPHYGQTKGAVSIDVLTLTVDQALARHANLAGRRVVLKIDVEGFEPEVIDGARELLRSGKVALIVWEKGNNARVPERAQAYAAMERELEAAGFRHFITAFPEYAGPLLPLLPDQTSCNVYSFGPGIEPLPYYGQNFAKRHPMNLGQLVARTPASSAAITEAAIKRRATDGARWADPRNLQAGAEARAKAAAAHIAPESRVLDLGSGSLALAKALPGGIRYANADLIARSERTVVVDFNQGQFPSGQFDVAVALALIEHLHEPEAFLRRCAQAAPRLIASYAPAKLPIDDLQIVERRQRGQVNDLTEADLEPLLARAGWKILSRQKIDREILLVAERA